MFMTKSAVYMIIIKLFYQNKKFKTLQNINNAD